VLTCSSRLGATGTGTADVRLGALHSTEPLLFAVPHAVCLLGVLTCPSPAWAPSALRILLLFAVPHAIVCQLWRHALPAASGCHLQLRHGGVAACSPQRLRWLAALTHRPGWPPFALQLVCFSQSQSPIRTHAAKSTDSQDSTRIVDIVFLSRQTCNRRQPIHPLPGGNIPGIATGTPERSKTVSRPSAPRLWPWPRPCLRKRPDATRKLSHEAAFPCFRQRRPAVCARRAAWLT
jgi:hypothetical protein